MPSHSHRTGKDLAYDFFCKLYNYNNNFNFHIDPAIENARFFLRGGVNYYVKLSIDVIVRR